MVRNLAEGFVQGTVAYLYVVLSIGAVVLGLMAAHQIS